MRSPGHPTYPFVPRSQIKHSYGLAISSACDNLDCRWIETIFITILVRNAIGNTLACRIETRLDAWLRIFITTNKRRESLDAARTSARATFGYRILLAATN